jgi:hypothetical protein
MPSALFEVGHDLGESKVQRERLPRIGNRAHMLREERVREAHVLALKLDQACRDRRTQTGRAIRPERSVDQVEPRIGERRRSGKRLERRRRERLQARIDEIAEHGRNRKGFLQPQLLLGRERARQFERIERVAAGDFVQAAKHGPRIPAAQTFLKQPTKRSEAQRPKVDVTEPIGRHHPIAFPGTAREQKRNGLVGEAARSKAERRGRRRVEPLKVIDRNQHLRARGERSQGSEKRGSDSATIAVDVTGIVEQQRNA